MQISVDRMVNTELKIFGYGMLGVKAVLLALFVMLSVVGSLANAESEFVLTTLKQDLVTQATEVQRLSEQRKDNSERYEMLDKQAKQIEQQKNLLARAVYYQKYNAELIELLGEERAVLEKLESASQGYLDSAARLLEATEGATEKSHQYQSKSAKSAASQQIAGSVKVLSWFDQQEYPLLGRLKGELYRVMSSTSEENLDQDSLNQELHSFAQEQVQFSRISLMDLDKAKREIDMKIQKVMFEGERSTTIIAMGHVGKSFGELSNRINSANSRSGAGVPKGAVASYGGTFYQGNSNAPTSVDLNAALQSYNQSLGF